MLAAGATIGPIGPFEAVILFPLAILWVVPIWVICGKLGWHPVLSLIVFIPLVGLIFGVMTIWEALGKAGHTRWLILILVLPLVNLVFAFWLAFSTWPLAKPPAAATI